MSTPPILSAAALDTSADVAATLMDQIQGLVNSLWVIDYDIPGGAGTLSGSPNNLNYDYSKTYSDSGTIVPGIPAYTITPAYTVPAVVSPAVPGWGTINACSAYGGKCTTETPGTPAYTVTPAYGVPAVVSPAVPALTGGYSTTLDIDATVSGISAALNPLFSSVTFTSGSMTAPNSSGLATESVTYNLDQQIEGSAIRISGRASYNDLSVTIAGVTTNFGDVSTGTLSASAPNIPIYFDAIIELPSFSSSPDRQANGVNYELFPLASDISVDNLELSTGVTAVADFIDDVLLDYLTDFWNASVVPLYEAVGATAPEAPSETLSNTIQDEADSLQSDVNAASESALNSLLASQLSLIQPYVQALTAVTWNYAEYPIFPGGDYEGSLMAGGLFGGVDASNSSFDNANLSNADFSNSNLSGSTFVNANLTGTNFSGATDAPSTSTASRGAHSSASSESGQFVNSVIFGANFERSTFDLQGAFYDSNTNFATRFDPDVNGLQYFSAAQFVAGNKALIKSYGSEVTSATGAFIEDRSACGCPSKTGLRADVITGKLLLDDFDEDRYFSSLNSSKRNKFDELFAGNSELNRADTLAMYHIAKKQSWSKSTSEQYLFSNSDLISGYKSTKAAIKNARDNYLKVGFFEGRSLNDDERYIAYVDAFPGALLDSGSVFDQASLAHHFVTKGYDEGQRLLPPLA